MASAASFASAHSGQTDPPQVGAIGAASAISHVGTSTPQDIYNAFARDTSVSASLIGIGSLGIVLGVLLMALFIFLGRARRREYPRMAYPAAKYGSYVVLAVAIATVGVGIWRGSDAGRIPTIFSNANMSAAIWESYKRHYIEQDSGRTIDPDRKNTTTSEGESYTMLRAVWLDDEATFDRSWQWTRDHLQRSDDHLFAWLYGQKADGSYGILTESDGQHSASDADSDIALALVFAGMRWQDPAYLSDARRIIASIWDAEVVIINGKPYLAANNVEKRVKKDFVIVNPSYLAPYAYRIFAALDREHPWEALVDSSYELLDESMKAPLDKERSADLPTDWLRVDRATGSLAALEATSTPTTYGYDAMRVPWRVALDWKWNKDQRAKKLLDRMSFLQDEWRKRRLLYASYGHDGSVQSPYEAPAIYGGSMGFFALSDKNDARDVYREKLLILFDPDTNTWRAPLSYYDANWAWFGMALYNDQLPNLAERLGTLSDARRNGRCAPSEKPCAAWRCEQSKFSAENYACFSEGAHRPFLTSSLSTLSISE